MTFKDMAHSLEQQGALVDEIERVSSVQLAESLFLHGLVRTFPVLNDLPTADLAEAVQAGLIDQGHIAGREVFPQRTAKLNNIHDESRALIRIKQGERVLRDEAFQVWFDEHPVFKGQRAGFVRRVLRK